MREQLRHGLIARQYANHIGYDGIATKLQS